MDPRIKPAGDEPQTAQPIWRSSILPYSLPRHLGAEVSRMGAMSDWRSFWDSAHSIYVNAHHNDVHYREIADQIAAFVPGPGACVLDYRCGEGVHADRVAAVAAQVLLCDQAASVRAAITARFASDSRIRALAPEEVER